MEGKLTEERGDLLIHGLMEKWQESIIDVKILNTEAISHRNKDVDKLLIGAEREKKKTYLTACISQRRTFVPFVCTTDGVLWEEANSFLSFIPRTLKKKALYTFRDG